MAADSWQELVLPVTDRALVDACATQLASAPQSDAAAVDEARLRFAWALAHSTVPADPHRALELLSICAFPLIRFPARSLSLQGWKRVAQSCADGVSHSTCWLSRAGAQAMRCALGTTQTRR